MVAIEDPPKITVESVSLWKTHGPSISMYLVKYTIPLPPRLDESTICRLVPEFETGPSEVSGVRKVIWFMAVLTKPLSRERFWSEFKDHGPPGVWKDPIRHTPRAEAFWSDHYFGERFRGFPPKNDSSVHTVPFPGVGQSLPHKGLSPLCRISSDYYLT